MLKGIFGVPKQMVAEAAYDALMKFELQINEGTVRKIQSIHYVNLDAEATAAFVEVFSNPRASQRCRKLGGHGDFVHEAAAAKFDLETTSRCDAFVERSSVPRSVGKSPDGKRQRRLKVSHATRTETDSDSMMESSKRQKMSASCQDEDDAGEMPVTAATEAEADEDCVICLCPMTRPKKLACGHSFCADCIDESFRKCQPKCPSCGRLFGVMRGNQPPGSMTVQTIPDSLPGFERCGTLHIMYNIPSGTQNVSLCFFYKCAKTGGILVFFIMAALRSRCGHYIFALWFLLSFFFSSPNLSHRRLDVCHTCTHGLALVRI